MCAVPRRDLRILLALSALALAFALGQTAVGLNTGFLFMAPALVILLPLIAGRYLGEQRLARFTRSMPALRRAVPDVRLPRPAFRTVLPRGGRLIAASLAVRPPPVAFAIR